MTEFSQGICADGAAILKDGVMLTIEEIIELLRQGDKLIGSGGEPVAWMYLVNGVHVNFSSFEPPDDAYDAETLVPLCAGQPPARPEQPAPVSTSERRPVNEDADEWGNVFAFSKIWCQWDFIPWKAVANCKDGNTIWMRTGLTRPAAPEQNAVFPRCECGRMLKSECDWGTSLCPARQGDNNDHD